MEEETPLGTGARPPGRRNKRRLNDRDLRELLTKDPVTIVIRLASQGGGLEELVRDPTVSEDRVVLLLYLINKSFTPQMYSSHPGNIKDIVDQLLSAESLFFHFHIHRLLTGPGTRAEEEDKVIVGSTLALVDMALHTQPMFAAPKVHAVVFLLREKMTRFMGDPQLASLMKRVDDTMARAEPGGQRRAGGEEGHREGNRRSRGMQVNEDDDRPEENFRELPLIPSQQDLAADHQIFVRRIRAEGRYADLEEYLDVLFRLFRADFIIPLQEGIAKWFGAHQADTNKAVKVYRDVQIVRPVCTMTTLSYRISFDTGPLSNVDWRSSQRLKYGSLLCLSTDNFQSYLCAVVTERKPELLTNGLVDVEFILERGELNRITDVQRDQRFVMVESPAYFAAYRPVLRGLQNLNDNNFPFIPYIVECRTQVNPPRYLQRRRGVNVRYDFRPLLNNNFKIKDDSNPAENLADAVDDLGLDDDLDGISAEEIAQNVEAGKVDVMTGSDWPTHQDLQLDDSQYKALHSALTKEFALVQGPPGTGKTYLGLKIIKMLLHNSAAWNDDLAHKRPMLIVCYTNHALDAFLEGVLDFFQGSLVRVGARSNSERLKDKTLTHWRTRAISNRRIPLETHEAKMRVRLELMDLRNGIDEQAARLEIVQQEIVKEQFLKDFIDQTDMRGFEKHQAKCAGGSSMIKWLGLERLHDRLRYQAEHRKDKLPHLRELNLPTPQRYAPQGDSEDDYDDDDDENDIETLDSSSSFRDSAQARRLDADEDFEDDDDDLFDLEDINFEREETEKERLRKRQLEIETQTRNLRQKSVALDLSGFCADPNNMVVQDRSQAKRNREADREVARTLSRLQLQYKRNLQSKLRDAKTMTMDEADQVTDIWKLKPADRWRLYRHWVDLYCRQVRGELRQKEENYFDKARKYREILDQEDRTILQEATVIGMTTTGAARYQSVLHAIGPRIIVVEEAAEVFEAHVVATLSRECQHLILIGDHKQLRPSATVYDLAKKCNLDVSLFERMIRNDFDFDCLEYQHRMRPEISRMMKLRDLYPRLQDHDMVKNMPAIKGVRHNVFYITHTMREDHDLETKTFCNQHEAEFLVALCDYLLKQGYRHDQITILSPYSGQVRAITALMPRSRFEGVRVSSVDNFQGEENDIILLSLVRSNNDNTIGFLKTNNRICVGLSRAKMGMYVIGNFELLKNSSPLLKSIMESAMAQKIMGDCLPLLCQNHPRKGGIEAYTAKHFDRAPEGGCNEACDARLPCGHRCIRTCHPSVDHDEAQCRLPCVQLCDKCEQRCQGDHLCCEHEHCRRLTEKVIPRCGHTQNVPCGQDPMRVNCQAACRRTLPGCGHPCQSKCGERCNPQCSVQVKVNNPRCGHEHMVSCCDRNNAKCSLPCGQELVCGHSCVGTGSECQNGRLHVPCQNPCRKILVCGHDCRSSCCQCPPCPATCQNRCEHSVCKSPCGEPCVMCVQQCDWRCKHHACSKLCGEICDRDRCHEPCKKKLRCGHPCLGMCGETCLAFCRQCEPEYFLESVFGEPDEDDRFVQLDDCLHILEVTNLDHWVDMNCPDEHQEGGEEEEDGSSDGAVASGGDGEQEETESKRLVKLPECPQCKTPIRQNLRYGNVVKRVLAEIETIKGRCRGNRRAVDEMRRKVEGAKSRLPLDLKPKVDLLFTRDQVQSESSLRTRFYQITLVTDLNHLLRQVSSAVTRWPDMADTYKQVKNDLNHMIAWTLRPRNILSDQERFDAHQEFERLKILVHLLHCRHAISEDKVEVAPRLMTRLAACIRQLRSAGPITENDMEEGRNLKEALKDVVEDPYSTLTDEEREEIVKAISLPTGSWYACRRGHYYVIGDCGRPMETATCPECRSSIGGESHALVEGNRQAPEFDNARGPRWTLEDDEEYARQLQQEEYVNWR